MNQQLNQPALGYYKGAEPACLGDVVAFDGSTGAGRGPTMIVIGYNKGVPTRLLCEWREHEKVLTDLFTASGLILIRRAPEPAEPAAPQGIQQSAAPKVTPADVEAAIASEHYYTGMNGANGSDAAMLKKGLIPSLDGGPPPQLAGVMHCTLICKNGQLATGEAFCADLSNPDHEAARKSARRRAFDKLFDMVVYAARERQAQATISSTDHSGSHEWRMSSSYGGELCANCGAVEDSRRGKALCAPPTEAAN